MDFMDYSDDAAMWMFTNDQLTRMQTALTQCPDRNGLSVVPTTPVAAFTYPSSLCSNMAAVFTDASTGPPTSWSWSVTPSSGVTITTNTVSNPSITFPSAGTYSVTLLATNGIGSNSITNTITVTMTPTVLVSSATICAGGIATLQASGGYSKVALFVIARFETAT